MEFKHEKDMKLFFCMHPLLQLIATESAWWAQIRGLDYTITSTVTTIEEDIMLGRVSHSHSEKRAYDARSITWSIRDKIEYREFINEKYGKYGALSYSGETRLIVLHDSGHGEHFHIQLHSKYKL